MEKLFKFRHIIEVSFVILQFSKPLHNDMYHAYSLLGYL